MPLLIALFWFRRVVFTQAQILYPATAGNMNVVPAAMGDTP